MSGRRSPFGRPRWQGVFLGIPPGRDIERRARKRSMLSADRSLSLAQMLRETAGCPSTRAARSSISDQEPIIEAERIFPAKHKVEIVGYERLKEILRVTFTGQQPVMQLDNDEREPLEPFGVPLE
jgi:hypothetical protein